MGVKNLTEDEDDLVNRENLTIGELIQIFGKEQVRRGLEYMKSLDDADKHFRESVEPEMLDRSWEEAFGIEGEVDTEASSEWAESVKEKGLGIDDGE